ncbi:MAG: hypothetical protein IPI34_09745 [bacterium]|nr:hypothetical protein [bacterium]
MRLNFGPHQAGAGGVVELVDLRAFHPQMAAQRRERLVGLLRRGQLLGVVALAHGAARQLERPLQHHRQHRQPEQDQRPFPTRSRHQ